MEVMTMTQSVNLTLKVKNGDEESIVKTKHDIERIKLYQFTGTIKIVKEILVQMNEDDSLKEFFETAFAEDPKKMEEMKNSVKDGKLDEAALEKAVTELDNKFMVKAVESFQVIAETLPEKAAELLSVLSGIDKKDLEQQDIFVVLDIFDAIVEVNDIEALLERIKKSLGATMKGLKFLQMRKKATA
jgi:signal transduction protein with GAF and PtsI domain